MTTRTSVLRRSLGRDALGTRLCGAAVVLAVSAATGCAGRSADTTTVARVTKPPDAISVTNDHGTWTIRTKCLAHGGIATGTGYVSRLVASDGTVVVDDARPRGTLNDPEFGGLGAFGWHHARGSVGRLRFTGGNAWEISGRMCAVANRGFGVVRTTLAEPPYRDADALRLTIDVELSDAYTFPEPLLHVRYRYRFAADLVESWIAVTPTCPHGRCGRTRARAFVKEPKLVAHVTGGGYTRMATFDSAGELVCVYVGGGGPKGPIYDTGQCDAPARERLRFDYGSATSGANGGCDARPCLDVVAKSYVDGPTTEPWHGALQGFDGWALAAAARPAAYRRDTPSIDGVVWGCKGASPADAGVRRWEVTGRRDAAGRYLSLGALFPAWEGGRGGYDCEPLARAFGPSGETYGAYVAYSLTR